MEEQREECMGNPDMKAYMENVADALRQIATELKILTCLTGYAIALNHPTKNTMKTISELVTAAKAKGKEDGDEGSGAE